MQSLHIAKHLIKNNGLLELADQPTHLKSKVNTWLDQQTFWITEG